jgi:hypothetical protein
MLDESMTLAQVAGRIIRQMLDPHGQRESVFKIRGA